MIKRIALFCLLSCAAALAQTTTFTANLKDLVGNVPTAYVELTLKNCAGSGTTATVPHVNGVGVLTFPVDLYPTSGAISATVYDETVIVCGSSTGVGYYHVAIYQGDSTRSLVKKLLFADDFDIQGASFNLNSASPRSGAVITPPPATAVLTNPAGNQTIVQPAGTALSINHLSASFTQNANGADAIAGARFTDTSPTGNLQHFTNAAGNADLWTVDVTGSLLTGIIPAARVSSGQVAIANGGTGQSTASAAFNALSPNTTLGDMTYASGTNANTRLPGNTTSTKEYLSQTGTGTVSAAPAWAQVNFADLGGSASLTTQVTGTLPLGNGGTGQTTAAAAFNALSPMTTLGDTTYESGANTAARLAGNTTTTKKYLSQTGTGTVSAAPSWVQPAAADLSNGTTGSGAVVLATSPTISGLNLSSVTLTSPIINTGVSQGSGFKHQRTSGCSTTASANANCPVTLTWTNAFADTSYTVTCSAVMSAGIGYTQLSGKTASAITISLITTQAVIATSSEFDCIAVHD